MNINAISKNEFTLSPLNTKENTGQGTDFKDIFSNLLAQTVEMDTADKNENIKLVSGESENMHDTLIAAEKADLALLLSVQIRNKVIDAYSEIMRMQI